MSIVFVGLGGNEGASCKILQAALESLQECPNITVTGFSSFYKSKPLQIEHKAGQDDDVVYASEQADYINAVACLETDLSPVFLLSALQQIEADFGRTRNGVRWGPRTLDLDILLYDDVQMQTPNLTIPHPGMLQRDFVLYPLQEIKPDLSIPGFGQLQDALNNCDNRGLVKLDGNNSGI